MIKSRKMGWARNIARIGRRGMYIGFWWKTQKEGERPRRRWENNIKMVLRWGGVVWTGFMWLRIGTSGGVF
jgi:hypothetical protein